MAFSCLHSIHWIGPFGEPVLNLLGQTHVPNISRLWTASYPPHSHVLFWASYAMRITDIILIIDGNLSWWISISDNVETESLCESYQARRPLQNRKRFRQPGVCTLWQGNHLNGICLLNTEITITNAKYENDIPFPGMDRSKRSFPFFRRYSHLIHGQHSLIWGFHSNCIWQPLWPSL